MKYWIEKLRDWYLSEGKISQHPIQDYREHDLYLEAYFEIQEAYFKSKSDLKKGKDIQLKIDTDIEVTKEEAKFIRIIKL